MSGQVFRLIGRRREDRCNRSSRARGRAKGISVGNYLEKVIKTELAFHMNFVGHMLTKIDLIMSFPMAIVSLPSTMK